MWAAAEDHEQNHVGKGAGDSDTLDTTFQAVFDAALMNAQNLKEETVAAASHKWRDSGRAGDLLEQRAKEMEGKEDESEAEEEDEEEGHRDGKSESDSDAVLSTERWSWKCADTSGDLRAKKPMVLTSKAEPPRPSCRRVGPKPLTLSRVKRMQTRMEQGYREQPLPWQIASSSSRPSPLASPPPPPPPPLAPAPSPASTTASSATSVSNQRKRLPPTPPPPPPWACSGIRPSRKQV